MAKHKLSKTMNGALCKVLRERDALSRKLQALYAKLPDQRVVEVTVWCGACGGTGENLQGFAFRDKCVRCKGKGKHTVTHHHVIEVRDIG